MNAARLAVQSTRSISRFPLRASVMMLGSVIGVAALTFVVSVGQGAQVKITRTIRQVMGDAGVVVVSGGSRLMGSPRPGAQRLTLDDMDAVAREVPNVAWDPQAELGVGATVRHDDAVATARVIGQSERWSRVWGRGVARGRSFDAADVRGSARVALIGETVARALFGTRDPIDGEIRVGAVPFRVIGVLESYGTDMHGMDRDNEIIVPVTTLLRRLTNADAISAAKLLLADASQSDSVVSAVRRVLRARHAIDRDRPDDFTIISSTEIQKNVAVIRRALVLYVPLASTVVLLVGGIVAAMLMLASVNERVSEIGVRRAVGARPEDIQRQFLVETTVTMLAGATFGVALGALGVHAVEFHMQLGATLSIVGVLLGVAAAAVTGLLAGVVPARRAARLHPVDALR